MDTYPEKIKEYLKTSRVIDKDRYKDYKDKRKHTESYEDEKVVMNSLLSFEGETTEDKEKLGAQDVSDKSVIYATDSYKKDGYKFTDSIEDFSLIIPRSEKAEEEQKARVKTKAEVFTPSWVCNLQNNLIDNSLDYILTPFNVTKEKGWTPTEDPIKFSNNKGWIKYVTEPRLEITCGEAPYLFSRYDTVTGTPIPVRDKKGRFARIGILDRKLRVVSENAEEDEWVNYALAACYYTQGYEWQGDNLILARVNMIETFRDYYIDFFGKEPSEKLIERVAEISSWNIWQMDGLKQVVPDSCIECSACESSKNYFGHKGDVSVIRFPKSSALTGDIEEIPPPSFYTYYTMDEIVEERSK